MSGYHRRPDMSDPAEAHAHRVMEAVKREYANDALTPRFVVVIEMPPEGRVGLAATADDAIDTLRLTALAHGIARSGVRSSGQDPLEVERRWAAQVRLGRVP